RVILGYETITTLGYQYHGIESNTGTKRFPCKIDVPGSVYGDAVCCVKTIPAGIPGPHDVAVGVIFNKKNVALGSANHSRGIKSDSAPVSSAYVTISIF